MNQQLRGQIEAELDRHWIRLTLLAWVAVTIFYVWSDWNYVRWLSLGDTDDNMRLMQVRGLLAGQGWFDLTNYRLNPPTGFNIHWSRIVDLPIAGLILFFRLFTTNAWAERLACGIAPLIPLSITMVGIGATVRRLVHPLAWPLAVVFLLATSVTMLMYLPERIDHHGWQLAMLSLSVAGLCDPRALRGGVIVGLASAVSISIGLEMLPYAAMAGAILTLRWIWAGNGEGGEATRLAAYAISLAGGTAAGFAGFASNANYVLRCDALTPVYLSVMVAAGVLLFVLAWANPASRAVRLGCAVLAGAVIVAGFVHFFPQCLGRPEQVSPELQRNWLDNVREAKPIYKHPFRLAFPMAALPIVGVIGVAVGTWRARRTPTLLGWACVALFVTFATLMLLWQVRVAPAAQLMAIPGSVALAWLILPWLLNHRSMPVRVIGTVGGFLIVSGLFAGLIIKYLPVDRPNAYTRRVNLATSSCIRTTVLSKLDYYPAQTIFTFVDLGPRLITLTHHDAIAGPYHRNGDAILDVQHAFGGTPDRARAIMKRHGATLLLICPNAAESTNYRARNPGGFYDQLAHGTVPAWLTPLPLPKGSPLRLFRID
ncbi:AcrB/AcrD/AcrF family protein [Sphingomonas oligophenolica]|uniref:AcrB/AcrD/AcrF family protein n=1 Tax=Sphingomonas oligophenolica TaxID=301154 RepID=A0A502CT18_9SPHN|nr:AcrB/AcrD/AcrF family protein [Sphingomonas oligophenolica]TPG15660.1 AcrB/AcrD/AcrF family protein [Sphingomonas oligophenolica]